MGGNWRFMAAAIGMLALGLLASAEVQASQKKAVKVCSDAYVAAQTERKAGRLGFAKKKLLVCGQNNCPAVIKNDCLIWLSELEAHLPTIVVQVSGKDGKDVTDVRVFVDGVLAKKSLDGRPIELDPGAHVLRVEAADNESLEQKIVAQQGVKNRAISVSFAALEGPAPAVVEDKGQPVAAYVFGALAVGAAASWTTFGILGFNEVEAYKDECLGDNPSKDVAACSDAKASAETKLLGADISGGVTGGLLGIAVGLFIYHHVSEPSSDVQVAIQPSSDGARASLTLSF
jgi:hypothetical protein